MYTVLELEEIGENYHAYRRQAQLPHPPTERYKGYLGPDTTRTWVAEIVGITLQAGAVQYQRRFLSPQKDYSRTNSTGSRGIYLYFYLESGIYEVHARESWHRARRYFIRVQANVITEISAEEVQQWQSAD